MPKAQIILDAAKVSAASGGNSEPKHDAVRNPDIIEHFGKMWMPPQLPERVLEP
ncbi:MAG: hypothetical protein ACLUW8_13875 [Subdoligranulum sp.]